MAERRSTGSGRVPGRIGARPLILLGLVAGLVTVAPVPTAAQPVVPLVAAAPPGATVEITPNVDLVDFQAVRVTGSGFTGETLLEIFQCRGGALSERDCDGYNADFIDVRDGGVIDETVYVDARIWLPSGVPVDCRTAPDGCEIGVGFMLDADEWPEAALHFDPDAPLLPVVTGTVTPSTGLEDGAVVRVHGEHLSFREEGFAYLCGPGSGIAGTRCDLDRLVRGVPDADGAIDLDLMVQSRFTTPFGDEVDCRTATGGCEVVVSWGFGGPPDRQTAVPVSFSGQEPPTTPTTPTTVSTTVTTTRPKPPVTPSPPAEPARPVRAIARFTG
jgi:hypothetical protein